MSKTKSDTEKSTNAKPFQSEMQKTFDQEQKQGFRGVEVDSTPNEAYTVAGVTSGAPTPETDVDTAAKVRKETGLGLSALEAAEREKGAK